MNSGYFPLVNTFRRWHQSPYVYLGHGGENQALDDMDHVVVIKICASRDW